MKKDKHNGKINWRAGLIILGIFSPLIIFLTYKVIERKRLLETESEKSLAIIEYLMPNQRKGKSSRQDVIYYSFIVGNIIFHEIGHEQVDAIKNWNISIGDVYEIVFVKTDPNINEVNYKLKVDTTINYDRTFEHIYQSSRHRKILNK